MLDAKDITSLEAFELIRLDPHAILIDTRTPGEWNEVGSPLVDKKVFRISSHFAPHMEFNAQFLEQLNKVVPNKGLPLLFMCKTNGRSRIAASIALKNGYQNCFVVSDGYMGSATGQGWLKSNLPHEIICQ